MPLRLEGIPGCQFDNPDKPRDPESYQNDRDRVYSEIEQLGGKVILDKVVYPDHDEANGSLGADYNIIVGKIPGAALSDENMR